MSSDLAPPWLTRVNGIGLWNSWTRNFKSPLLALLDLIDNSVDAAFERAQNEPHGGAPGSFGAGGVSAVIAPDFYSSSSSSQPRQFHGKVHIDADSWNGRTTGLKIINNSSGAIKNLEQIMEVYSSSKGRSEHGADHSQDSDQTFADSIGENGVGLKQGCATLSDLSFVLTRAGDGKMGMAVVAQSLQSAAGVFLPHVYFDSTDLQLLRHEMRRVFSSDLYRSIGECVARYGDNNLEQGIDRMLRHFAHLNQSGPREWGEEKNVFCIVLHQLKHGRQVATMNDGDDFVQLITPLEQQYSENSHHLMQELRDELPRNYIHINMEVRVGGEVVRFFYWQRRLAELTMFYINVDENHSYTVAPDWHDPKKSYPLRIFCGFDSVRLTSEQNGATSCSLSIYSRFSGRLIKYEEDARALLKLQSGGTDYSQGLTVVVDDMLGNLPLNPTKQDVAFGEQAHGDVHKRNIYAWLGAVVKLYYTHHLDTKCDMKKRDLTQKVKSFGNPVIDSTQLKILNDSTFTEFRDLSWRQNANGTIICTNRKSMTINQGRDTLRRFPTPQRIARFGQGGVGLSTGGVGPGTGYAGLGPGYAGLVTGGAGPGTGADGDRFDAGMLGPSTSSAAQGPPPGQFNQGPGGGLAPPSLHTQQQGGWQSRASPPGPPRQFNRESPPGQVGQSRGSHAEHSHHQSRSGPPLEPQWGGYPPQGSPQDHPQHRQQHQQGPTGLGLSTGAAGHVAYRAGPGMGGVRLGPVGVGPTPLTMGPRTDAGRLGTRGVELSTRDAGLGTIGFGLDSDGVAVGSGGSNRNSNFTAAQCQLEIEAQAEKVRKALSVPPFAATTNRNSSGANTSRANEADTVASINQMIERRQTADGFGESARSSEHEGIVSSRSGTGEGLGPDSSARGRGGGGERRSPENRSRDAGPGVGVGAVGSEGRAVAELGLEAVGSGAGGTGPNSAHKYSQKRTVVAQMTSSGIDSEVAVHMSTARKRRRAEVNRSEDESIEAEMSADAPDDDALPLIDLGAAPDATMAESEVQDVTPVSRTSHPCSEASSLLQGKNGPNRELESASEQIRILQAHVRDLKENIGETSRGGEGLREEIKALHESVKRHKEKSHERKKLVRKIDVANTELKLEIATLKARLVSTTAGGKSACELQLEEQVDELTEALERSWAERDVAINALEEKIAALTEENSNLKREQGLRRKENELLTPKVER